MAKRYHIEWSLGTLLVDPATSPSEFLTVWRHDPQQPFTEAERQAKQLLMPHLAEAFRAVRLQHFLKDTELRLKAWALADDQGFIREMSPAFGASLRAHWPNWYGSLLPDALAQCVVEGRAYTSKTRGALAVEVRPSDDLPFLEIKTKGPLDRLTAREGEIMARYANGETYLVIASALALSPTTVRNHIAHCFKKLDVKNKAELANLLGNSRRADAAATQAQCPSGILLFYQ